MSTEVRTIRPFRTFDEFEELLRANATLSASDGSDPVSVDETLFLDPGTFISTGISLSFAPDRETLKALRDAFKADRRRVFDTSPALSVIVLLATPRLRFADVACRIPVTEVNNLHQQIEIAPRRDEGSRPRPLLTPRGGCVVDVLVVLDEQLDRVPLRPWRKGSWLAHARFKIRTQIHDSGFQPLPLDQAVRAQLQLGDGVQHYATKRDGVVQVARAETLDSVIEYYVDEATLERISERPRGPLETLMQTRFVLDAIAYFLYELRDDDDIARYNPETWSDTLIDQLARLVAEDRSDAGLRNTVDWMVSRPNEVIARLEDEWDLNNLTKSLWEEQQ